MREEIKILPMVTKSRLRFEFFYFIFPVSSTFFLSVAWVWTFAWLKAVLWICPCPYLSLCVCLLCYFVWHCVFPSQRVLLCIYSRAQEVSHEEGVRYFPESFNRVLKGIKSLTPTDPDNKQYYKYCYLSSNILITERVLCSTFMADIYFKDCFQPLCLLLSADGY